MFELLKLLKQLYEGDYKCSEEDGTKYFDDEDKFILEVISKCDELLIVNGMPNWDNIGVLKVNGYSVYPGDYDSFVWLVGCIKKDGDRRILVFG